LPGADSAHIEIFSSSFLYLAFVFPLSKILESRFFDARGIDSRCSWMLSLDTT
jgi:hypothetical protein